MQLFLCVALIGMFWPINVLVYVHIYWRICSCICLPACNTNHIFNPSMYACASALCTCVCLLYLCVILIHICLCISVYVHVLILTLIPQKRMCIYLGAYVYVHTDSICVFIVRAPVRSCIYECIPVPVVHVHAC